MTNIEIKAQASVPIADYTQKKFVPLSRLAHEWQMHSAVALTPAEDRTMVREPAAAVPDAFAKRLGPLVVLMVPYVACSPSRDLVAWSKPQGETHSAVWIEGEERIHLILPCRELDAHDTGFEFLASVGELLRPRLHDTEIEQYTRLLKEELRLGITGEIDEEAQAAKQRLSARTSSRAEGEHFENYRNVSFVSTAAEYMHGLWHDVQIRVGAEHLPVRQLHSRMSLLSQLFPPNPGYSVFAKELDAETRND